MFTLSFTPKTMKLEQWARQWLILLVFLHPAQLVSLEADLHLAQSKALSVLLPTSTVLTPPPLSTLTPLTLPLFELAFPPLPPPNFLSLSVFFSGHSFFQCPSSPQIAQPPLPRGKLLAPPTPVFWSLCFLKGLLPLADDSLDHERIIWYDILFVYTLEDIKKLKKEYSLEMVIL